MDKIYVFGHKKPDTDSVTSAISYANLKKELGFNAEARVLGDINNETKYVLKSFKFSLPKYLNDVKLQIKDLRYRKGCLVDINESIYNAYRYMVSKEISSVPITENNKFSGILSMKDINQNNIYGNNNKLISTYDKVLQVLDGEEILKFDNDFNLDITTIYDTSEVFLNKNKLNNNTCLIVNNRYNVIEEAIKNKVKLIVLTDSTNIKTSELDSSIKNRISIIKTNRKYSDVVRLITLSNYIKTIEYVKDIICFDEEKTVDDVYDALRIVHHNYYPIINQENDCLGLLKVADLNERNLKKVILVDHNELSQSVDGLEEAEIMEIIDHHKINALDTDKPINFRNMTVGSTNTIIYNMYRENNVKISKNIAGIMASGIISDTLLLKSPTTTALDVKALNELSEIAKIDYEKFGVEMFKMGSVFVGKTYEEIFFQDFKSFDIDDKKFGVSQVLTVDVEEFLSNKKHYLKLIEEIAFDKNYDVLSMFVTDIINECSYVFYNKDSQSIFDFCFKDCTQGKLLPGFVSRKKQIIPLIMKALGHN